MRQKVREPRDSADDQITAEPDPHLAHVRQLAARGYVSTGNREIRASGPGPDPKQAAGMGGQLRVGMESRSGFSL